MIDRTQKEGNDMRKPLSAGTVFQRAYHFHFYQ